MDSSDRNPSSTLGGWLAEVLPDATELRLQTAYYSDGALWSVEQHLTRLLKSGGLFRMVLGGNPNAARVENLERLLEYLSPYPQAKVLAVIPGPTNMLVHSKMYHVQQGEDAGAWVGSANFTAFGTSTNLEAGIGLDSRATEDAESVEAVREKVDGWFAPNHVWAQNIVEVRPDNLPQLLAWRVATRQETGEERQSGSPRAGGRDPGTQTLPSLPFLPVPSRPRSRTGTRGTGPAPQPGAGAQVTAVQGQTHPALPPGVVATVKVLVGQDIRGMLGLPGTWYLSLGLPWEPFFGPIQPPPPDDPRINSLVEARLVSAPTDTAASGQSNTALQLEGAAGGTVTHLNARVNLSKQLATELRVIAATHGEALPQVDDLVVAEYLAGTPTVVRLTYVRRHDRQYTGLRAKVGTGAVPQVGRPPNRYGWLTAADVAALPPW